MAGFTTIRVPGQQSIVSDVGEDVLDLVPGPGVTITTNTSIDTITISSIQGYTGSQGVQGTTGYTGSKGGLGYSGSHGIIGFSGSHGITGFTGSQGIQGVRGYSGSAIYNYRTIRVAGQNSLIADQLDDVLDIVAGAGISITTNSAMDAVIISATGGGGGGVGNGYTGSAGTNGSIGFTGSVGDMGTPGPRGFTGSAGAAGGQGALGFTGSVGPQGIQGTSGIAGYYGSQGDIGYTGSRGLIGLAGGVGFTGSASTAIGFTGSTGNIGYTGSSGVTSTALIVACSDEMTAITAGTNRVTFRMPYLFNMTAVRASLTTAQSSGLIFTVDINKTGVGSLLTTKLTIDNNDKSSVTATTPAVLSTNPLVLADDSEITVDIDQIGSGTATGLKITLIGYL